MSWLWYHDCVSSSMKPQHDVFRRHLAHICVGDWLSLLDVRFFRGKILLVRYQKVGVLSPGGLAKTRQVLSRK